MDMNPLVMCAPLLLAALPLALLAAEPASPTTATPSARDYPVKPVPFTAVHLNDLFWTPRMETNRAVSIPFAFEKCEESGRVKLFERAAAVLEGKPMDDKTPPGFPFDDTDVYKVIEGAAYALNVKPDPKLESYVDGLIDKIAAAQEPDGYLYTTRTINPAAPHSWAGTHRWEEERGASHELYNLGHLYESAVAYYQATGKRKLLDVSLKSADLLDRTFGPGKQSVWPGHQIIEMGLAKLYRVTGDERYLKLAKFFLDERQGGAEYSQAHKPVTQQTEAVGHAVRAVYMYSGMADVAALTGDNSYLHAIDAIWDNVVTKKLYVTGGIGARHGSEAFGDNYELPNGSAYNETCAAIGNVYWNHRLFLLHEDAKYIDVMERTLYNGLLAGVSLDGKGYFYPNPLSSEGQHTRSPWFGCACCPGNMTRFLASVPGYVYAQQGGRLFVNLYAAGEAEIHLDNGQSVRVKQETRYPWDGLVKITLDPAKPGEFTLLVRIPGWARGEAVPSDLYAYTDKSAEPFTLKVNGQPVQATVQRGYVSLSRPWKAGDTVELSLPMPIRRVVANAQVEADRGRVAIERGPVVYCLEWPENGKELHHLLLADQTKLTSEFNKDLLGGVVTIQGKAHLSHEGEKGVESRELDIRAIPYYAWANRGAGDMEVWIANRPEASGVIPQPTVASESTTTTSFGDRVASINSRSEPKTSNDQERMYYHCWPRKGTSEWVQYTFAHPTSVSEAAVYWYDDTGRGECRVPATWRLTYRDGDQWKPVKPLANYGVALDAYNVVAFEPVKTDAMRIEFTAQKDWSVGIQKWNLR